MKMACKVAPIVLAVPSLAAASYRTSRQSYGLQDLFTQLCACGMKQSYNPDWPGDWQKSRAGKENL